MKKIIIWIVALALFVGVIAGASVLYNNLSEEYSGDALNTDLSIFGTQEAEESEDGAPAESVSPESSEDTKVPEASETLKLPEFSAPDFTVLDENGNRVKLSDFHGKPIVVNFWATWCTYCVYEMPEFETAHQKYPDVQFVMVNPADGYRGESVESAKSFIEKEGYSFDVFFDTEGEAAKAYYVSGYPMTFFINANGELAAYANQMIDLSALEHGIAMIR